MCLFLIYSHIQLEQVSLGARGDSFYEYLLKAWLQSGKTDTEAREMYDEAIAAIAEHMIRTSRNGLIYSLEIDLDATYEEHKMYHLACFAGKIFESKISVIY